MIKNQTDNGSIETKVPRALKKHTAAIHSSNSLTLLQRKLSNILLFHAYPQLKELEEYKISIKELCNYLGKKGHNYDTVKQALKALISTVVEWNVIDDKNEEGWTASSILASVNITNSICSYAYSPRMREFLYNPATYGRINLLIQSSFTSSYGLALYENCIRYRGLAQTKTFPIDVFRKMMGIPDDKYLIFRDLKRRVLDKAVNEVNSLSDLLIDPILKREGRKVVSIAFILQERPKKRPLKAHLENPSSKIIRSNLDITDEAVVDRLQHVFGISSDKAVNLLSSYGASKVREKMSQIESTQPFLLGNIRNLAGYIVDALKNDYLLPKSSDVLKEEREADELSQRSVKQVQKDRYAEYLYAEVNKLFENLDDQAKSILLKEFYHYLENDNYCDPIIFQLTKDGHYTDRLVIKTLTSFLQSHHQELLTTVLSFQMFSALSAK